MLSTKNKVKKYFISGILTTLPLLFVYWIAKSFSGFLIEFFPGLNIPYSLIISFAIIVFIGFLVTNFLSKKIKKRVEVVSKQKGFISNLASLFLNMDEVRNDIKEIFEKPVLYKVDDGIYELGYISNESFEFLNFEKRASEAEPEKDSVWVYIPTPLSFTGSMKLVEKRKIRKISNRKKESISMFILSAGIIEK